MIYRGLEHRSFNFSNRVAKKPGLSSFAEYPWAVARPQPTVARKAEADSTKLGVLLKVHSIDYRSKAAELGIRSGVAIDLIIELLSSERWRVLTTATGKGKLNDRKGSKRKQSRPGV